jgi:hypothetical protein
MSPLNITETRCEALFVSVLQCSGALDHGEVRDAIMWAVRAYGSRGCAQRVAEEFGDHPETAVPRMCSARRAVAEVYGTPPAYRSSCASVRTAA